jgi:transcriptional regulator with XRE-family HTH domain
MSYGYSQSLVRVNKEASIKSLGVALGRMCIAQGISVQTIADTFGVSRMTVYNWFKGHTHPNVAITPAILRYINTHKK